MVHLSNTCARNSWIYKGGVFGENHPFLQKKGYHMPMSGIWDLSFGGGGWKWRRRASANNRGNFMELYENPPSVPKRSLVLVVFGGELQTNEKRGKTPLVVGIREWKVIRDQQKGALIRAVSSGTLLMKQEFCLIRGCYEVAALGF